MINFYLAL